MPIDSQQLKAFLLDLDLTQKSKIEQTFEESQKSGQSFCSLLVKKNIISEIDLLKLSAYILGIPFINLEKEIVPREILEIIPEPLAREHNIVAFAKKGNELRVAMLDPEDLQTLDFIKKKTGLKILPNLTTPGSIKHILKQYQKSLEVEFGEIIKTEQVSAPEESREELVKIAQDLPIIKIVDTLLKHAILENASDIHIEPQEKDVVVRYRIDGILHDAMTLPKSCLAGVIARIKVLANLKLDEHRLPQDGRFKIESEDWKIAFRVSVLPVFDGEKIVMRLLDESAKKLNLEKLGIQGRALEIIKRCIQKPNGMILVTGPTGSGKTTTLYTILDILNTPDVNINTVEDPIEYRMPRINQTQVYPKIGLTFATGLRSLLRQDPDIIMVGEIRDQETAEMAVHAALTGHLVLSTLHTNDAAGTLPRLLDMGIEAFLAASTVVVIIAQRLVRRVCQDCRESYRLKPDESQKLKERFDINKIFERLKKEKIIGTNATWQTVDFYRGKGCQRCHNEGYKGRLGIYEVMEINDQIRQILNRQTTSAILEKTAIENGMLTMLEDGIAKAVQGVTTIEEVLRVTEE